MGDTPGENAEALFNEGLDHHDRQEYDEAIRCYERAIELEPRMVVAHNNLGMVYIDKGQFDEAIAELAKTLALDEHYAEAYNNLGFVYRRTGDEPKAAAFYEKFLTLEAEVEDAPKIRGWLEQVRAKAGHLPDVKELIAEAAGPPEPPAPAVAAAGLAGPAEPEEPEITGATEMPSLLAAAVRSARERDSAAEQEAAEPPAEVISDSETGGEEEAVDELKTFLMQPSDIQTVLDAPGGGPSPEPQSPPAALQVPPVAQQPPSALPVPAARKVGSDRGPDDAAPAAPQPPPAALQSPAAPQPAPMAPRIPPAPAVPVAAAQPPVPQVPAQEAPEALCEKGLSQFEKGDLPAAEQTLRKAVARSPQLAVARSTLGRVLAKAGRFEEASAELRQAVGLDPTDAAGFYVLGYALRNLSQDHTAAEAYEHYLELTPDAAEAAQIRAWIAEVRDSPQMTPAELYDHALQHYEEGELDQALEECEEVFAADETNGSASLLLGRILIDKGDLIRAVAALKRAESLQPGNAEVYFYFGQAYERRGLSDEAGRAYQRCLAAGPTSAHAEYVRNWIEQARGAQAAAQAKTSRCEYCFRAFPPDRLSTHEGKKICSDCMASLNIAPEAQAVSPAIQQLVVDRAVADEAAKTGRRRAKARIGRFALLGGLSVVALMFLMLLVLRFAWLSGPFESIGVYRVLDAIGLKGVLTSLGVPWFPEEGGPGDDRPPTGTGEEVGVGQKPPEVKPLAVSVDERTFDALPLIQFTTQVKAEDGEGDYVYELSKAPHGMSIDEGAVTWTPRAVEGRFEFPRRVPVEVKVTSGDETKTVEFEVVVRFAFEPGPVVDAGVGPGDEVRLAVGNLRAADDCDEIAVAWGRYRKGRLSVLHRGGASGAFSSGFEADLGGLPSALVLADVTSDGRTDVVLADWFARKLRVFRQNGDGSLSAEAALPTARGVDFLVAGDVDGDDAVDVVASPWTEPKLCVYSQVVEGGAGRLTEPKSYPRDRTSGWNRAFVGPIHGGPRAVYHLSGSGGKPYFTMYRTTTDRKLDFYMTPGLDEGPGEHPLEAMPVRLGEGAPYIAALVGGEKPELHVIGAKDEDLELLFKQEIADAPHPIGITVADLNGDAIDDVIVLCVEEIHVLLGPATEGEPFVRAARVEVPLATGPLAVGELTGDGLADIAVALDDGKLRIVRAAHRGGEAK